uniref:Uncharacterized protein n=1 Tax=Tetraselmis sp. GSL018 TaxID=582737 RepID=A0A061R0W0_9CHLO
MIFARVSARFCDTTDSFSRLAAECSIPVIILCRDFLVDSCQRSDNEQPYNDSGSASDSFLLGDACPGWEVGTQCVYAFSLLDSRKIMVLFENQAKILQQNISFVADSESDSIFQLS